MTEITRIGVVGAGTMGAGIAQVAAVAGLEVRLFDLSEQAVDRGLDAVRSSLGRFVRRGRLDASGAEASLTRIRPIRELSELAEVDAVIEAASEDLEIKRRIFQELDRVCPPNALLASNTSSLSVTAMAAAADRPERVVGMHFFNPPPMMALVEVVRAQQSDPASVERAVRLAERLGKTPVVVADTPAFVVNRVARPFPLEALRILGEGLADIPTIDRIMRLGGFAMGPFELMDLVGIDIGYAVARSLYEQTFWDPRYRPHAIQRQMVEAGRLGRKSGRGFYDYSVGVEGGPPQPTAPLPESVGAVAILGEGELAASLRRLAEAAGVEQVETAEQARLIVLAGHGYLEVRRLALRNALEQAGPGAVVIAHCAPYTVTELGSTLRRTDQVAGFAILGDPGITRLVEVAGGLNSSEQSVGAALGLFRLLGKEAVAVGDGPGMVLGRIVSMIINEAAAALDDGIASAKDIDTALRLGVAYPKGPLEWADELGLDLVLQTVRTLQADYGDDRYRPATRLRRLVQAGRLGLRTGRGFF